jgi:hypothetical protein
MGVEMQDRSNLALRLSISVGIFGLFMSSFGCASSRVSDLDAYEKIPMNRIVPYPSEKELRKRAFEIVVVDRPSAGFDDQTLEIPRAQVRRGLEKIAAGAGAGVIDRSLQDVSAIRTEAIPGEIDGPAADAVTGADYALATRFSTYRYASTWKKPFQFLWESAEDVAAKTGTCNHTVEVEFEVQVIQIGANDRVEKTFALGHSAEQTTKDLDSACTIPPATLNMLYETAIDEALGCLDLPLGRLLSPRGHISAHRKAPAAERHIFRVSLGSKQGIQQGDTVEIRREQRTMSPSGEGLRTERVISLGRVTDQITPQASWVAIDLSKVPGEILEGDVVRPVEKESLLASLSGPNCESILEVY